MLLSIGKSQSKPSFGESFPCHELVSMSFAKFSFCIMLKQQQFFSMSWVIFVAWCVNMCGMTLPFGSSNKTMAELQETSDFPFFGEANCSPFHCQHSNLAGSIGNTWCLLNQCCWHHKAASLNTTHCISCRCLFCAWLLFSFHTTSLKWHFHWLSLMPRFVVNENEAVHPQSSTKCGWKQSLCCTCYLFNLPEDNLSCCCEGWWNSRSFVWVLWKHPQLDGSMHWKLTVTFCKQQRVLFWVSWWLSSSTVVFIAPSDPEMS